MPIGAIGGGSQYIDPNGPGGPSGPGGAGPTTSTGQLTAAQIQALVAELTGDQFGGISGGSGGPGGPSASGPSTPSAALAALEAQLSGSYGQGGSGEESMLTILQDAADQQNQASGMNQLENSMKDTAIERQMNNITDAIQLGSKLSAIANQTTSAVINNV